MASAADDGACRIRLTFYVTMLSLCNHYMILTFPLFFCLFIYLKQKAILQIQHVELEDAGFTSKGQLALQLCCIMEKVGLLVKND